MAYTGTFAKGRFVLSLEEVIDEKWAVAAIRGAYRTESGTRLASFGRALRRQAGFWRIELGGGPEINPVAPDAGNGTFGPGPFTVRVNFSGRQRVSEPRVWVDDRPIDLRGDPQSLASS